MGRVLGVVIVLLFGFSCFAQSRDASFSKDGSKIVYVSKVAGKNQIFLMNKDGSNKKQLTKTLDQQ